MNIDLINNANAADAAQAAMAVIDRLQNFPPHLQAHGLGVAFIALADHWSINLQDLFTATKNMIADPIDGHRPEFKAVQRYINEELTNVR